MTVKELIFKVFSDLHFDLLYLHGSPRVLFYHGVADSIVNPTIESESILAADFERQLKYIVKQFKPISIDEFYNRYINNSWQGKEILLTFDDGYRNMLTTGLPMLEKYDVPFALFLTTDNISYDLLFPTTINRIVNLASSAATDEETCLRTSKILKTLPIKTVEKVCDELQNQIPSEEYKSLRRKYASVNPLTWDEVKIIAESQLCTIGSHCVNHICCHNRQPFEEVKRQFSQSKSEIEKRLGISCDYLSYPNGNYTPEVINLAEECGYKMAFSTRYEPIIGMDKNKMAVGRIYVPYDYSRFVYSISRYPR